MKHMNRLAESVKEAAGQNIIRHARKQIGELVKNAEGIAAAAKDAVIRSGIQTMQAIQSPELERLIALSKVNPGIRKKEIEYLQETSRQTQAYMQQAQLRLDAIRIAIIRE